MPKREQISILGCKVGKKIVMDYYSIPEGKNYSVENDETPHPNLMKALHAFNRELAEEHYIEDVEGISNFMTNGFSINEKEGEYSLILSGKLVTAHEDTISVSSGKIPYNANGDIMNNVIEEKLLDLRECLFQYMFEDVNAQGKLNFESEASIDNVKK
jgi:hypothetical protein